MNVACTACPAKYAVPDDKVRGKKARITCKHCGTAIIVDGTELGAPGNRAQTGSVVERRPSAPAEAVSVPPAAVTGARSAAPATAAPPDATAAAPGSWLVALSEDRQEELDLARIVQLFAEGSIDAETYVWREGMPEWKTPFQIPEVARALRARGFEPTNGARAAAQQSYSLEQEEATHVGRLSIPDSDAPSRPAAAPGTSSFGEDDEGVTVAREALPFAARSAASWKKPAATPSREPEAASAALAPSAPPPASASPAVGLSPSVTASGAVSAFSARAGRRNTLPPEPNPVAEARNGAARSRAPRDPSPASRPGFWPRLDADSAPPPVASSAPASHELREPRPRRDTQPPSSLAPASARPATEPRPRRDTQPPSSLAPASARPATEPRPRRDTQPPSSLAPPSKGPRAARREGAPEKRRATLDELFGLDSAAGSEDDPTLGAQPTDANARLTGARNESSVLFSLDALVQAERPEAQALKQERATAALLAPDPGEAALLSRIGEGGMGTSVLSAPDFTAPVRAPEPEPLPLATARTSGPIEVSFEPPRRRSRVGLWLVLLLLIAGGGAAAYALGLVPPHLLGRKPAPSAVAEKPPEPKPTSAPVDQPIAAAPEPEASGAATLGADAGTAASSAPPSSAPPKAVAEAAKPQAPSAAVRPAGEKAASKLPAAEKTDESGNGESESASAKSDTTEQEAAAADAPPFDRAAAAEALGSAAASAPSCKLIGGPTGTGQATVTFAPSGRVTATSVSGDFAGTSVGGCVAKLFRAARVPAFGGGPVTVTKRFSIE